MKILIRILTLASIALATISHTTMTQAADALKTHDAAPAAPNYFSTTEIQLLWGDNFDFRSNFPDKTSVATATLEHFSTWKYGDNYFYVDVSFDTNGNGNADAETDIFGEYYPSLSLSKMTGKNFSFGPISDISALFGAAADGDGFLALMYGGRVDFKIPGFNYAFMRFVAYDTVLDPFNRDLDTTYQVTLASSSPIIQSGRVKVTFDFFGKVIGNRGQGVKTQMLLQPQLRLDVGALLGGQENKFFIGTEVSYFMNKFGTNVDEFAPQILGVFKF